jgi:hypothetical protein
VAWRTGNGEGDDEMTRHSLVVVTIAIGAALVFARPLYSTQPITAGARAILEQGVTNRSAEKRANAVHALWLVPNSRRAQELAESARADADPKSEGRGSRTLSVRAP